MGLTRPAGGGGGGGGVTDHGALTGLGDDDHSQYHTDARGDARYAQLTHTHTGVIGVTIDGGGSAITTGQKGYVSVPFDCTITGWTLVADQSGSIVIDVWKDTYANFPPTVADTIAGTEKPTLSSVQKNEDSNLTTWTTAIAAGDVIGFNVDSASTVTRVTLTLKITRS